MQNELVLCGRCIHVMKNQYIISETKRRKKITCENCGHRRYGVACKISDRKEAK